MSGPVDRRSFLKTTAAAAATALALPHVARSAEKRKLRIAIVGVGGRGGHALGMAKNEEVVALCDVDTSKMSRARKMFPNAGVYRDYREMFESRDDYDAVIVSTPDHHHYPASIRAIRAGKAVYCEKPLAWSVWESLQLAAEAEKREVPTQLGNQGMGGWGWRVAYDYVKAGAIGEVREVHTWTGQHGRWFADGVRTPEGEDPVPKTLNWDLWLGPAPVRPYKKRHYHPARWRGWIDFGNGALGDWCCHLLNAFYKILEPGYPASVECIDSTGAAIYLIGTKGTCWVVGSHNNSAVLVPETRRKEFGRPKKSAPPSRGHEKEFLMAARGEIPYNAKRQRFTNSDEANTLMTRKPRDGWYVG